MPAYDIRPLQLRILKILQAVDSTCRSHGLRYYVWAGTMIGAVRHHGFIPWDDDLDIAMPRPDYDLLAAHAGEWLPSPMEMVCGERDAAYPLPFAKVQDASTTLIERRHLMYLGGIYLDVFPIDGTPEGWLRRKWHFARYEYYKRVLYLLCRDPYKHGRGASSWVPLLCRRLYSLAEVQAKIRRILTQYDYDKSRLVADYDDSSKGAMPKTVLGTPTPYDFEGISVWGVEHYDTYLSNKYGDYMTIPDGRHQRQHNFHYLDLDHPYKDYPCGDGQAHGGTARQGEKTKILVLHVRKGYEEREAFMRDVLGREGLDFEFILDGDMADLTPEVLDRYFTGEMKQAAPYTSCTMKHLLSCEHVLEHGLPGALVLEDDMMLYKNFRQVFDECMEEVKRDHIESPLINFEDSALRFVPGSQRRKGKHLYRAARDRFAGCYYLSHGAAEKIMNYVHEHKCDQISDVFHKALISRIGLAYYWCHPCIATQGTHNGKFPSSLNEKSASKQRYRANTWKLKLAYKKLIYLFR